jgi:hypothetical protein
LREGADAVEGIRFVVDESGKRTAVLIDLARYGALWEDFYDLSLARQRRDEPRESLEEVEALLSLESEPTKR